MRSLRQKTYGLFVRPYINYGGDRIVIRTGASVLHPCQPSGATCPAYAPLQGGAGATVWMLYKNQTYTSFALLREAIKELQEELGYMRGDYYVAEVIPTDNIVTPLS